MLPDINKLFYFDHYFAPIFDPKTYNTPEVQFGYVLSVMRQARNMNQDELQLAIDPTSKRGGSTISYWENGRQVPTVDELREISKALQLGKEDSEYLGNLLLGNNRAIELTNEEKTDARQRFEPLREVQHPAYLLDHYGTILDFNSPLQTLLQLDDKRAQNLIDKNLLYAIFHPFFGAYSALGEEEAWEAIALKQIWRFRSRTFPFRHHNKYISLISSLVKEGSYKFLDLWYREPPKTIDAGSDIEVTVHPSSDETMRFVVAGKEHRYDGLKAIVLAQWKPV